MVKTLMWFNFHPDYEAMMDEQDNYRRPRALPVSSMFKPLPPFPSNQSIEEYNQWLDSQNQDRMDDFDEEVCPFSFLYVLPVVNHAPKEEEIPF